MPAEHLHHAVARGVVEEARQVLRRRAGNRGAAGKQVFFVGRQGGLDHRGEHQRLLTLLLRTRKAAGLTQQEVADRLRVPQSFVAKYEGGERRLDVLELIAVAKALDADPLGLLSELV